MTITKKLIIIFIIIVIFILSISIYLGESFRINKEETVAQNSAEIANEVLKRIDYNFHILIDDLFLYSLHDYLYQFFSGMKIKNNEKKIADSLYVSDKLKERFFKYWGANRGYQLFNNVHIIALNGNIISSTDESLINKKTDINNLLNELEKTKYNISGIFYDKKSNDYIKSISVLINKENGENKGIIQAEISTLSFIKEVEIDFELYDLSQLYIINIKNKFLIFKSGSYNILEDISKEKYFKNIKENKGYFTTKENNQKFIYSYAKKSVQYKWMPDWSVIIKNSEKEILSPLNDLLIRIYLIISFLIIILSISIILIIRNILSSVKNLQQGAIIIGSGNLNFKIKSITKDELNEVAVSLNDMAENLVKVTAKKDDLEKEIEKRKKVEDELKQKNADLTRFVYTVSHDLKSPLITIKSFSSYLKDDINKQDDLKLTKDINYIHNAADKMGVLLDDLLELSRIGRIDKPKKEVLLQEIVKSALELVAGRINERKVSVSVTEEPINLFGSPERLTELYQNLIDNAIKFMGEQTEPKIQIGIKYSKKGKKDIIFFVRDNGSGIDPRYKHKIFGLFEKLDQKIEGSGIGLALVKRIIEVHNGTIWFESEGLGKGATFYFTLEKTKFKKKENEL